MSRRKNQERAIIHGLIFRDGHLVKKEDWYKAHPTREMLAQRQAVVDKAVNEEKTRRKLEEMGVELPEGRGILVVKDGQILDPKDTLAVLAEAEPYYCTKCKVTHRKGAIHKAHLQYRSNAEVITNS